MIPIKMAIIISILVLVVIWIYNKQNGSSGSWDKKKDIEEYALIMNSELTSSHLSHSLPSTQSAKKGIHKKIPYMKKQPNDRESIGEKICRDYIERKTNHRFLKSRPEFMKNPITKTNLELDCFCEELKLAVEYNGKQHYEFVPFFHKNSNDFHSQKYRDYIKRKLCNDNGIKLIEVPYTVEHDKIPEFIDMELYKLGI